MNFYILAGGKSKRMGQNKALMQFDNKTIIERVVHAIPANENRIKLITNSFTPFRFLGLEIIEDRIKDLGPIGGIHAGLIDSTFEFNFFLACDLPFLNTETITSILQAHSGQQIFGVKTPNGPEPLCTIYAKSCVPVIEEQIQKGIFSLQKLFDIVDTQFIHINDSEKALFNLNTRFDYEKLNKPR